MGDGCCGVSSPSPSHPHDESRDSVETNCAEQPDCLDGDLCQEGTSCYGRASFGSSQTQVACCTAGEERCDEKCIIAAAALECEKSCDDDSAHNDSVGHKHEHDEHGKHPTSACSTHLDMAFDKYSAYLEAARCICRSIIDRGIPATTCCSSQPQKAPSRSKSSSTQPKEHGHSTAHAHGSKKRAPPHHHHGVKRGAKKSHHDHDHDHGVVAEKSCCGDKGSGGSHVHGVGSSDHKQDGFTAEWDMEKGPGLERVTLNVQGMTCSGCGNNMERALNSISGVSAVRVNFVMGNAEFSINPEETKPEDVIKKAEKATGFQCTRLSTDDKTIDVLASGASARDILNHGIEGVNQATIINKNTVRLAYDPTVIGARTLVQIELADLCSGLAPLRDDASVTSGRKRMMDQLIKTAVATVLTIPVCVFAWDDKLPVNGNTRAYVSIALGTLVQLIAIPDFYLPAIGALVRNGVVEMDMLVVISITAAYVYSVVAFGFRVAGNPLETPEFFETSTLLITLVLLGRLIAAFARVRAVSAVSLRSLQATTALIIEDGKEIEIDARLLQYGDQFKVLPHTQIPTDGMVNDGSSEVDESMLTGESLPVHKKQGDLVIAGTMNGSGTITAKLTLLPGMNTVSKIAELVEEAANSKPKIQDIADKIASYFVLVVSVVALIVTITWVVVGLRVQKYSTGKAVANAITYAVATLAISCPCALGLAVPMVLVVAGGIAANNGVIIKSAQSTERARKVTDVVFDKTGTITEGDLDVVEEIYLGTDRDESIAIAKALVSGNKHPVSAAIAKHLQAITMVPVTVSEVHVIPGSGVQALYKGDEICAGNPQWTKTSDDENVVTLTGSGMTLLVVTYASSPVAVFGLRTRLRPEAAKVVSELTHRNITVHMVSGDQANAVESVATEVGINHQVSQCTPAEKKDYVAKLMAKEKVVMFVGDGTNDAVAVTQADVGVQLGSAESASDVTRSAADVILLAGLEGIPFLLDISAVSFRRMAFNFVWSGVYNVLAILFASGALVKVRVPPAYAGLGEIVSVLPVIAAAFTMRFTKIRKEVVY